MQVKFIRHISDDILKENQELKTTLIAKKQQLSIYEKQIVDFIEMCNLKSPVLATPEQTLELFITVVKEQIDSRKEEGNKLLKVTEKCDKLNRQNESLEKQLNKRKNEEEFRQKKWRQGLLAAEELEQQMKQEISGWKLKDQVNKNQIKQMEERQKIEIMLIEEGRRKEIEEIRQHYHKTMMEERDRLELQHIREMKSVKLELSERQRRVKDLERMSEKLASNVKLDPTETTLFSELVKSLQQSQRNSKSIDILKHELDEVKQHSRALQKLNINLQSLLTQHKVNIQNYLSVIERQQLQREEFENKLKIKIELVEKHEKDKQSMESYYTHKWNQQFQSVKKNLEKTYQTKLNALQKEYLQKTQELLLKTDETYSKIRKYQARNSQLQSLFKSNQTNMENAKKMLEDSKRQLLMTQREKEQIWFMSREQIIATKIQNEENTQGLRDLVQKLEKELIKREKKYETVNNKFNETLKERLEETVYKMTKQLTQQSDRFENQKKQMKHEYDHQISKLNQLIQNYKEEVKSIKNKVTAEYEQRLHSVIASKEQKLKQKDEDCLKKLERAAYKYKELQLKFGSVKKEIDEERHSFSRDILMYERQIESFKDVRISMEEEISKFSLVKEDLKKETQVALEEVAQLKRALVSQEEEIKKMAETTEAAIKKAGELQQQKKGWQDQLRGLQIELRHEFQKVKRNAQNEITILKSKLWYLQEKTKQPMISEKNYRKLQELQDQKDQLKNMVEIKQAENIVLSQVKDYYENRFRQTEYSQNDQERRFSRVILARKTTKARKPSCVNTYSNSMYQEPKEITLMKKYISQNNRRQHHLTMNKVGCNYTNRIKTNPL